jgi:pimeloyl-ACP methyl ester carboxylesterase
MAVKLIESAQARWHAVNAPNSSRSSVLARHSPRGSSSNDHTRTQLKDLGPRILTVVDSHRNVLQLHDQLVSTAMRVSASMWVNAIEQSTTLRTRMSTLDSEGTGPQPELGSVAPELGAGFVAKTANVNGTTIHYVRGGSGPALVLLHGFPQDWFEWRRVMPRLSQRFTVIAVDLRGVGGSAPSVAGYAAVDLAEDVHLLIDGLDLGRVHVVGHDVGGWVAYAFARRFPDSTRTVMILETPIPGIEPWLDLDIDVPLWHGAFHMVPGLPEALVADRQAVYFRYFFDVGTKDNGVISDADVEHYADAYGDPDRLRSAFEIYRAIPANMAYNVGQTDRIDIPLLLVGGEHVFGPVLPLLADNLRTNHGWSDIEVRIVADGKHYLVEERPDDVAELIESHSANR